MSHPRMSLPYFGPIWSPYFVPSAEPFFQYRYPPYTEEAFQALSGPANVKIPDH
jgi:hypothetical protein